ncbi:zinc finger protein 836-like isoform X3 [Armigeres subalbatus]|uniref:zinc finger protein 836-like isoform X3 n=1 Tax=Armigeres subalbatus TaxID=124917 RepID=UPI002ED02F37
MAARRQPRSLRKYEPTDGLPQKVCPSCSNTMQQIQTTLDVFRSNDILLRKYLLGFEEIEVKDEEDLVELGSEIVEYSLQDTYDAETLKQCNEETEEWLEDNYVPAEYEDDLITQDDADSDVTVSVEQEKSKNDDIPRLLLSSSKNKEHNTETILNTHRSNDFFCYICRCEPLESSKVLLDHLREHSDQLPYTCQMCVMETIEIKQMRSLNNHLRMHEQPFKCNYCDRRYADERGREHHAQSYHLAENASSSFTCDVCGKLCTSALALRTHMKRHIISYTCDICSRVFAQKSKLKRHVTTVHENTTSYECKICTKRLKTIDAYELHVRTIHEGRRDYECDICGRRFTTATFLRAHQKQSQGGTCRPRNNWTSYYSTKIDEDGTKTFCCSVCSKEFTRSIAEHLRTHFPIEFECSICFVKLPNKTSFDRHRQRHSELRFKCQDCEKSFLSSRNLASHVARTHASGESFVSDLILEDAIDVDVEDYLL